MIYSNKPCIVVYGFAIPNMTFCNKHDFRSAHHFNHTYFTFQPGIQLAEDEGKFMYCLPRNRDNPRGRYNPYDLQVVSADRAQQAQIYWTVSASHVTMVR